MTVEPDPVPFPEGFGLRLDPSTRVYDEGRTLLGGAPLRFLRLSDSGARAIAQWKSRPPASRAERQLARRLADAGLAHPLPPPVPADNVSDAEVTVVVPVRDRPAELAGCLDALGAVPVLVVDDGSSDADTVLQIAAAHGAQVLRRDVAGGPAAARNAGWEACTTRYVAFVDSDCLPSPGWLGPLLAHLCDPTVAAAAPRIVAAAGDRTWVAAFEAARSPLDLGGEPGYVTAGGRVPYLPAAALVLRRDLAVRFDVSMPVGEDVDLVWRLTESGHRVRYEPASTVAHRHRTRLPALLRRRYDYGTSAAPLACRHRHRLPAVTVNPWSAAAWALLATRRPLSATAVTGVASGRLAARLRGRTSTPYAVSARLAVRGTAGSGRLLAAATTRTWLPLAVAASLRSQSARRALAWAVVVPALLQWRERRPALDPLRWTAATLLDDAAYCAGVWRGCVRERTTAPLRPDWNAGRAGRAAAQQP